MKKTLLFICLAFCFVVLFTGCLEPEASSGSFSPPGWIRGTWADTTQVNTHTFTAHTITFRSTYTAANISSMYEDDEVIEIITDSLYQFTVNSDSVFVVTCRYELFAPNTLNFTQVYPGGTSEPTEMKKQ